MLRLRKNKTARTSETIRAELAERRELAAKLPSEIETATREHQEAMWDFDPDRGRPALARRRKAEQDLADTLAAITRLEAEEAEARGREAAEAQQRRYNDAKAQRTVTAEAFKTHYPQLARRIVELLRDIAQADLAVEAANADRPDGEPPLQSIAGELWSTAEPRVDLSDTIVEQWIRKTDLHHEEKAAPIPDELVKGIALVNGKLIARAASGFEFEVVKVKRVHRKFLAAVHYDAGGFARRLCLPGLAHEQDHFQPAHTEGPEGVLAVLRELEHRASLRPPGRLPKVEVLTPEQAERKPFLGARP